MLDQNMVQKKINYFNVLKNSVMISGKSILAEKITKNTLKNIQLKTKKDYKKVFKLSLKNSLLYISTVKVKKRKFQRLIPFFILKEKRISKTIKYLGSLNKKNPFLNDEILKIANNKGVIQTNLKTINQQFFINKNYTHYRWFI